MVSKYYCFDGDKIGESIQNSFMLNDLEAAIKYSNKVNSACREIEDFMLKLGAEILFKGGDSLIFIGDVNHKLIEENLKRIEVSFSIGVGYTVKDGCIALFEAKSLGRGMLCENLK